MKRFFTTPHVSFSARLLSRRISALGSSGVDPGARPWYQLRASIPLMRTPLQRLLIVLSLLYAGPLAQPGQAAGEPDPFPPRSLEEAALVRPPVNEPSVPDFYSTFGLELDHPQPSVEHQGPEDSSESRPSAGPPEPT